MKIGMIGLGRMGTGMVMRLVAGGHECVVYDRDSSKTKAVSGRGVETTSSLEALVQALQPPRAVWIMLPAGAPTHETIARLEELLQPGDALIDGGNAHFKDSIRRAESLAKRDIRFLDVGVSGGVWGCERGYCLMIGGDRQTASRLEPLFRSLAPTPDQGRVYCGSAGAGHFTKMVHNGIEYGMMQALAEGFDILRGSRRAPPGAGYKYDLDVAAIAEAWRSGSVVSSWLLDLAAGALQVDPALNDYEGRVQDSGEGRWTLQAALELEVPATVLASSIFVRFRSREKASFAEKLLSAMRHGFGGHREAGKGAA